MTLCTSSLIALFIQGKLQVNLTMKLGKIAARETFIKSSFFIE